MEFGGAHKKAYEEAYEKCKKLYEKAKRHPKFWICFFILLAVILLICLPPWRVSHFEINNDTKEADLENQYRATLAQIIGGFAILSGLYFTWGNLITAREGQITERFTKAVDQLGKVDESRKPAIEIRLGGIYALERISKESDKDYWSIMEILTSYIRKNSSIKAVEEKELKDISMDTLATIEAQDIRELPFDISAILTVIKRRQYSYGNGETKRLNLSSTNLTSADLSDTNLTSADLSKANLQGAILEEANLQGADLQEANLQGAILEKANLQEAYLQEANLQGVYLQEAYLQGAYLQEANLQGAKLEGANLKEADLQEAKLGGAKLEGAKLEGANLKEADLEGANLEGANLEGADLKEANLKEANLKEADLKGANLVRAHLEGADLTEADLKWAHLEGALNLTPDQLSKVKTLYATKLDEDLREDLENKYLDKYKALFKKPD